MRYKCVVSVGNCADLGPTEYLRYLLQDKETKVIGFYLESLRDGRCFFETLRKAKASKPVVILKGGRTDKGQRVASSHTGALAGNDNLWEALSRQTGAILTNSIDEFIDTLLVFQCLDLTPASWDNTVLFGNGGGASVLATDVMARCGLELQDITTPTAKALGELIQDPGTSLKNPVDIPSGTMRQEDGMIVEKVLYELTSLDRPKAVIFHLNMPQFLTNPNMPPQVFDNLVKSAINVKKRGAASYILLVLRSDGSELLNERKRQAAVAALEAGIPVYNEIADAINALAFVKQFEMFRQ